MGRKIPAKKHRGVKDPLVQQARREKSLKSKINAPPKDPDEQPVPKSLSRLFAFQNKDIAEEKPKKKNLKRLQHENNKSGVGDNPISRLRKLPGESGRGFSLRINSAIKALHGDVTEEDYYPIQQNAIRVGGAREFAMDPAFLQAKSTSGLACHAIREDIDEEDAKGARMADFKEYRAKKVRRATGGRKPDQKEAKLTRTQKQALKKKSIKEKQQESQKERQEVVYERVAFGDISHAPPSLTFKNRKLAAAGGAPRPGRRDLLLTKLLQSAPSPSHAPAKSKVSTADTLRRERARLDAVQAYRDLKANKLKNKQG